MVYDGSSSELGFYKLADPLVSERHRLESIADEIRTLARKIPEAEGIPQNGDDAACADGADTSGIEASDLRRLIRNRRLREEHFPQVSFADPAWDILLALFEAELSGFKVMVSGLCASAAVPPTTALRWIGHLVESNIIERHDDPTDRRRQLVNLKPDTSASLRRYFSRIHCSCA